MPAPCGQTILAGLRRSPRLYRGLRTVFRSAGNAGFAVLRRVSPPAPRWGPPRGFYSELAALRAGRVEGRVVREGQGVVPARPGGLRAVAGLEQDQFQPWPVFWSRRRDARLVGSTRALLNERKQLALEAVFGARFAPTDPAARTWRLPPPVRLAGVWTSVFSRWSEGFYHWFMDVLPRLALLGELPPETGILGPSLRFPWQRDTLRWLGWESRWRATPELHLVLEDYCFSAPTAMTGCDNPYALEFLRHRLLPFADAEYRGPRRFYLTRRGRARSPVNEPEVEALFVSAGWAVVDPEQLTLAQQMRLFAGAEAIVAPHGGALVNLAWCRPETRVLELCADNFLNGCYESMAVHLGLHHAFLVGPADAGFRLHVPLPELRRRMESL